MTSGDRDVHAFPRHVGRYELLLPIGSGATATVYLARTRVVGDVHRDVALKLVHPHLREELGADLIDEARVAAAIRHPHVVSVIEADDGPHGAYLALDYVEGETLAYLVRRAPDRRLPLPVVARILGDMLDGLHAAHEHRDGHGEPTRLVHRDISLRNVLVGTDGLARLTDFGIAKVSGRGGRTKTGFAKGTIPYMSPEQAAGSPVDQRSDVWAAAVVAWELLTGRRLFAQENEASTLLAIVGHSPVPMPSSVRREIPAEVDDALRSALTRDRDRRCPDARELHRRLVGALEQIGEVASHAEVGAVVARLADETLAARRRAVREVVAARASEAVVPQSTREGAEPAVRAAEAPDTSSSALVTQRRSAPAARWWVAGVPAILLGGVIVLVAVIWSPRARSIELASIAFTVAPASPIEAAPQARSVTLLITANAPIAEIRIGDRLPLVVEPKSELTAELAPEEARAAVEIRARSVDGREATTRTAPGGTAVALSFAPRAAAKATETRRRPGRGASPYEK